jgi:hypothetical protein
LQEKKKTHGCGRKEYIMNFRKIPNGCDKQGGKRADGLKEAKGTN